MRLSACTLLAAACLASTANASNLVLDFSVASNPNGVWTYGSTPTLGGAFSAFTTGSSTASTATWTTTGFPQVSENISGSSFTNGTVTMPTDFLILHPSSVGEYAVVRYTVAVGGIYDIAGAFQGQDFVGPTTTDVHILLNSATSLFSGNVNDYATPHPFSVSQSFSAGDTIDFAVGFGNGTYFFDSTGLQGTITVESAGIPEPGTWFLSGSAMLAVMSFTRRARKR